MNFQTFEFMLFSLLNGEFLSFPIYLLSNFFFFFEPYNAFSILFFLPFHCQIPNLKIISISFHFCSEFLAQLISFFFLLSSLVALDLFCSSYTLPFSFTTHSISINLLLFLILILSWICVCGLDWPGFWKLQDLELEIVYQVDGFLNWSGSFVVLQSF